MVFGRRSDPRATSDAEAHVEMIDAAYVPFWTSELVRAALEDAGIIASVFEQRPVAQGVPMARILVPADRLDEARRIIDDVTVT